MTVMTLERYRAMSKWSDSMNEIKPRKPESECPISMMNMETGKSVMRTSSPNHSTAKLNCKLLCINISETVRTKFQHVDEMLKPWGAHVQAYIIYIYFSTAVARCLWELGKGEGNRPWRPIGLWDVEASTFSRHSAHRWRWGCQPYAPATLYLQENCWYSFLLEAESTPGLYYCWKD
jgi:hypothetical protein